MLDWEVIQNEEDKMRLRFTGALFTILKNWKELRKASLWGFEYLKSAVPITASGPLAQ